MQKKKIVVVFSSHLTEEENEKFIKHVNKSIGVPHSVYCFPNFNERSLSEVYNEAIGLYSEEGTIMVFCHNDMTFDTKNWGKKLLKHFNYNNYQILGIAGTSFIPESGTWWEDRSKMVGIVNHTNGLRTWTSQYSPEFRGIRETITVDGLLIAVDTTNIEHNFDTNFGKFHYYDISFCMRNYLDGVNIGVISDIRVTHQSVGETNSEWEENRLKFVEKYKKYLPIKHVSENSKLKVLISCLSFQGYTGSEMSNYELSKELVKQGCDVTILSQNIGEPLLSKAKNNGVDVRSLSYPPNYQIINNKYQFITNEKDFDVLHLNHKPIAESVLQLYPNTPAVMHVRSEVIPIYEVPILDPNIKKYISIRDSITEYIQGYGVKEEDIVLIDNPFDSKRFNTNYKKQSNEMEIILFVGTLDHLRKDILFDLKDMVEKNNEILWIIGKNSNGYADKLLGDNVKYFGIKSNVEEYIKKCDYTAGIFKGRTTIEGFLCGKGGWIYKVDEKGKILDKVFNEVPDDVEKYTSKESAKKVIELYKEVLGI